MNSLEDWQAFSDLVHKTMTKLGRFSEISLAESFFTNSESTEVTIRNSQIFTQNKRVDSGVGFRIAVPHNRVGFACTNIVNERTILEAAQQALGIAKASAELGNFCMPFKRKVPSVKGLCDPRIIEARVEDAVDVAERAINAAEGFDKRVIAKDGRVIFTSQRVGIENNQGVDLEEQRTEAVVYLGGGGEQEGEVTSSCYDIQFSRTIDLTPEAVGESAAQQVTQMFNPKPVKSFQGTVIFAPQAVSYQIVEVLIDALQGSNVLSGKSAWSDKAGQNVAQDSLTLIDDASLPHGVGARSFDDEGSASQKTMIVDKGNLQSFLHNATSAEAMGSENTGNASRSIQGFDLADMIIGQGYRTTPAIAPANLTVHPGNKSQEEFISETSKGVLVTSMAGFPQAGSGMISAQLSQAFFIEGGEVKHPMKGGMISGVVFDWLQTISGIGDDPKQFQNCTVPSIRVEDAKIVGASRG
ncbi:MAG: TldD/PmbA family protein [Candidatus Bathyarchaeota archaeon]|nr:MAG: TldD/PmbA family protein [Candidatus Bathyarchaeota archaeon]